MLLNFSVGQDTETKYLPLAHKGSVRDKSADHKYGQFKTVLLVWVCITHESWECQIMSPGLAATSYMYLIKVYN